MRNFRTWYIHLFQGVLHTFQSKLYFLGTVSLLLHRLFQSPDSHKFPYLMHRHHHHRYHHHHKVHCGVLVGMTWCFYLLTHSSALIYFSQCPLYLSPLFIYFRIVYPFHHHLPILLSFISWRHLRLFVAFVHNLEYKFLFFFANAMYLKNPFSVEGVPFCDWNEGIYSSKLL